MHLDIKQELQPILLNGLNSKVDRTLLLTVIAKVRLMK